MKTATQWLCGCAALLAGLVVIVIVLIATVSDWNPARPWINRSVSALTDRPFAINGDLRLHWVRHIDGLSWRLPRPRISATDMVIGNPDWAKGGSLAKIQRVTAVLDPLLLLNRAVALPLLDIEGAQVFLERRADQQNNWTFRSESGKPSRWRFAPGALRIRHSNLQLEDAHRKLLLAAEADSIPEGFRWSASGTLNGEPLTGSGMTGSLLALQDKETPYPLTFIIDMGKTHIEAEGTLSNPTKLAALDLTLTLSGASMAQLFPLTGLVLPETSPYATEGRLIGTLNEFGGLWLYRDFRGSVGDSDLHGSLIYQARDERPLLTATLVSDTLSFVDLGPLIGANSRGSNSTASKTATPPPKGKVLPIEPFKTDRLISIDARVSFEAKNIILQGDLPIDNLKAEVVLQDGVLRLNPLRFGIAGGQLVADIALDSRQQPTPVEMTLAVQRLKLKKLFPAVDETHASLGEVNGSVALSATGNAIASLLGSSSGEIKLFIDRGTVSKFILEAAGLNIANVVMSKLFGDREVTLNCAAADMRVTDGLITTEGFILDTEDALITVEGDINLASEQLALTLRPQSRGMRVLSLRSPLHVKGTFKKPDVDIDKRALALRGGAALALGALALPAAIIPLISAGRADLPPDNGCIELLTRSKEKASAPN